MKLHLKPLRDFLVRSVALLSLMFFLVNCEDDNNVLSNQDPTNSSDNAEAIASSISSETSGAADQLSYLSDLAAEDGISSLAKTTSGLAKSSDEKITSIDTVYDESTEKWTITISRERTISERSFTSNYYHKYTVQYLKNGIPQKHYIVNGDTANTIKFNIVEGTGTVQSNKINQNLESTSGSWVATITANNAMVVAGSYNRSANATFTTANATRSYDYSLSLSFTGLSVPINYGDELWLYLSGFMSGQFTGEYSATVNGETYQKSVNNAFAIAFSKKATYNITMDGEDYSADIDTGELQ
ncbi:MAG: hypothetical protein WAV89_09030 [Ignavibacteriaceae bacterium]